MLKTALSLSETLSQLTMTLHKRPDLARHMGGSSDGEGRKSVVEASAEIIQKIYTNCLNDRSSDRNTVKGKKEGIYMAANLVLKLLFAVCHEHVVQAHIHTTLSDPHAYTHTRSAGGRSSPR